VKYLFARLVLRLKIGPRKQRYCIASNYTHDITQGHQMTYSIVDAVYQSCELNVILTQLQCSVSFLNNDLYKSIILSSPNCACVLVVLFEKMHIISSLNAVNTLRLRRIY
jgi:hypothetical protein